MVGGTFTRLPTVDEFERKKRGSGGRKKKMSALAESSPDDSGRSSRGSRKKKKKRVTPASSPNEGVNSINSPKSSPVDYSNTKRDMMDSRETAVSSAMSPTNMKLELRDSDVSLG